jgi:hypothetical protein
MAKKKATDGADPGPVLVGDNNGSHCFSPRIRFELIIWKSISPSGVEHCEIRWRRATLPEAKMVLESYHAQQNLAMSASFTATGTAGTKLKVNGQADSVETELKDVANGQDVTLVPQDVTH